MAVEAPLLCIFFLFSLTFCVCVDTDIYIHTNKCMCVYVHRHMYTYPHLCVYTHTYLTVVNEFLKQCEKTPKFHVLCFLILLFRPDTLASLWRCASRFPLSTKDSFYWSFLATMPPLAYQSLHLPWEISAITHFNKTKTETLHLNWSESSSGI